MQTLKQMNRCLQALWLRLLVPQEFHYINGSDTLPAPLDAQAEQRALADLAAGRAGARDLLITHNLRLVVYIAKKFETPSAGIEDMISIGTIGLIKAVNTFEPSKKIKLATYASRCIENEILMYLRKSSNRRQDASIDEPLNTDNDGNELLLMDVLTSDQPQVGEELERHADIRKRKWRMRWGSRKAIYPGWKSGSSGACGRSWKPPVNFSRRAYC